MKSTPMILAMAALAGMLEGSLACAGNPHSPLSRKSTSLIKAGTPAARLAAPTTKNDCNSKDGCGKDSCAGAATQPS